MEDNELDVIEGEAGTENAEEPIHGECYVRLAYAQSREGATQIAIETGRNKSVMVDVGSPFQATVERIAEQAHYGGYYRVFLNGEEVLNPNESPATTEANMRIAITSYDEVG